MIEVFSFAAGGVLAVLGLACIAAAYRLTRRPDPRVSFVDAVLAEVRINGSWSDETHGVMPVQGGYMLADPVLGTFWVRASEIRLELFDLHHRRSVALLVGGRHAPPA